jgi:hypothetical protein
MSYVPYVDPNLIKSRLKGILNFNESNGGFNSFEEDAGGVFVTSEELNLFQAQAEQKVVRKLSSLYKIPLISSVNTGLTLADFEDNTNYVLQGLFTCATCTYIIAFTFPQQAIKARMLKDYLEREYGDLLGLIEKVDQASGRVYPAFEDLEYSKEYLTRQQNPIISTINADNEMSRLWSKNCL